MGQETLNYWKQLSHVMKYFRAEEEPAARLPPNFITGFLEVSILHTKVMGSIELISTCRAVTKQIQMKCHNIKVCTPLFESLGLALL